QPNSRRASEKAAFSAGFTACSLPALKMPIVYFLSPTCARAEAGHVTAAPINVMNSRRRMRSCLNPRTTPYHIEQELLCVTAESGRPCPDWVKTGPRTPPAAFPLSHHKRNFNDPRGTSQLCNKQTLARLFDHLVGEQQKFAGNCQPQFSRGFQIHEKFEFCRLLDWQFGGLGTFVDLVDFGCGASVQVGDARSIGH